MKKFVLLLAFTICIIVVMAQIPQGFNYQAAIRNSEGQPIANQTVSLRLSISDESGNLVYYSESHQPTTTPFGVASIVVGGGNVLSGSFSAIPWGTGNIHLKVEVDPEGGLAYHLLGITKLQAVPYALFAADGNQGPQGEPGVDGVGISSTVDNGDGTFTINYSDGSSFTTSNLTGTPGTSIEWLGSKNEFPSNPASNQAFYHSTERKAFIYSDNSWQVLAQDGSPGEQGPSGGTGPQGPQGPKGDPGTPIQWRGSHPSHPSSGLNYAYYNSSDGASYIFDGSIWQIMTYDGLQGPQGEQGVSIEWLGSFNEPPTASVSQAYYHTTDKKSYIWTGSSWDIIAIDGLPGATGPQGSKGDKGDSGTGLTNKGSWVSGTSYNPGDYVFAMNSGGTGNSMWIVQALTPFTSTVAPADDTDGNWIEFEAPSGEDGEDGISIQWLGTYPSAPSSPETNQAYYNSTDRKAYIWDGSSWQMVAQDGQHGVSISWQGSLASAPAGALNRAYYNTTLRKSFIHNGTSWQEMTQDGRTIISGTDNPTASDGQNGDFYLNTSTSTLFGPKSGGAWPAGLPLIGPTGPQGPQGIQGEQGIQGIQGETGLQGEQGLQGIAGLDGRTVLSGTADPTGGIGIDGDFYINTTTNYIFGPKIEGSWPAGVSLIGPQGEVGEEGPLVAGTQGQSLVHNGTSWAATSNLFTDASENVGVGTTAPTEKLDVEGNIRARGKLMGEVVEIDQPQTQEEEPIFVVRNKAGQIVFAVYETGIRMYVDDYAQGGKGNKSGFAIGGFTGQKEGEGSTEYFRVTPDSVRIFMRESAKGNKGGFAIGGYTGQKTNPVDLMYVSPTYTRIYIDTTTTKGNKSGFAIGGYTGQKGDLDFFTINRDSTRIFIDNEGSKGNKGGFAIGGFTGQKGAEEYLRVTRDSTRVYVDTESIGKGNKGGFAIGGFTGQKTEPDNYMFLNPENYLIGQKAGSSLTTGTYNSFMGYLAGENVQGGSKNVYLGYESGNQNLNGSENIAIGYRTAALSTSGSWNTFFGYESGLNNNGGLYNTFMGYQTGYSNAGGTYNLFIGYKSGYSNNIGSDNLFLGNNSGYSNTTGSINVFLGNTSGFYNTSGYHNIFIGKSAGYFNDTTHHNLFIGLESGYRHTKGNFNVFLGHQTGYWNRGTYNTFLGYKAGFYNTLGSSNVFIGEWPGHKNTEGLGNVFIGKSAGFGNLTGNHNVMLGTNTGGNDATGSYNVLIGYQAGYGNTSGENNIFIGRQAGNASTIGSNNIMLGYSSGGNNLGGNNNIFLGYESGLFNTTNGNNNIFLGYFSGRSNQTGASNVYIGYYAGYSNSSGSSNVFIGNNAGYSETGSNKLYIDNTNTSSPLIWGDFTTGSRAIKINGTFTFNASTNSVRMPTGRGTNNQVLVTDGSGNANWATLSLTSTSGTLAVNRGGTGRTSHTAYALIAGGTTTTGAQQSLASGSSGQILRSGGDAALPTWSTATYPTTTSANQALYSSSANIVTSGTLPVAAGGTGRTTLTANKVLVGNTTTGILQPANLHWDNTNSRLGISNTSPTYSLDVTGSARVTTSVYLATSSGNRVGIGTDSPSYLLDVKGTGGVALRVYHGSYGHGIRIDPWNSTTAAVNIDPTNSNQSVYFGRDVTASQWIFQSGKVAIGNHTPSYDLHLLNNSAAKPTSNTWTVPSDIRLKDVKASYTKGLKEILLLEPIVYRYKVDNPLGIKDTENDSYGFSAQDVQKVFPEAVNSNEKGYLDFDIHPILIAQINAIKQLNAIIEEQQQKIETLEEKNKEIDTLKAEIEAIKSLLNKLND